VKKCGPVFLLSDRYQAVMMRKSRHSASVNKAKQPKPALTTSGSSNVIRQVPILASGPNFRPSSLRNAPCHRHLQNLKFGLFSATPLLHSIPLSSHPSELRSKSSIKKAYILPPALYSGSPRLRPPNRRQYGIGGNDDYVSRLSLAKC
jgi:hypothetical protein